MRENSARKNPSFLQIQNASSYRRHFLENFYLNKSHQTSVLQELTKVNIYFKETTITVVEEHPELLVFDLVSNMGGILGLFAGISLLSMCEIIQFICELAIELGRKANFMVKNRVRQEVNHEYKGNSSLWVKGLSYSVPKTSSGDP